jgi:hypothetical protein
MGTTEKKTIGKQVDRLSCLASPPAEQILFFMDLLSRYFPRDLNVLLFQYLSIARRERVYIYLNINRSFIQYIHVGVPTLYIIKRL